MSSERASGPGGLRRLLLRTLASTVSKRAPMQGVPSRETRSNFNLKGSLCFLGGESCVRRERS